ncbi:MAG: hypothetical protein FWD57_07800, partial [Polyangiaceae bacterium]|nr:hypothetical protein [Polyangiaceae bacterium]
GIAVSVQASTSNSEDAKARINAIAKVAANHPEFPVLVVRHNRSRAPKSTQDSIRDLAQSIAQTLESAGVSSSRIAQFDAGQYRPIVNDPLPPPPNSKNDRVEIVLVAPSQ